MKAPRLHAWNISPSEAVALQRTLCAKLVSCPLRPMNPRFVAGADVSYGRGSDQLFAAVIVLRLPELETVEERWVTRRATYPYVPGLLSFREAPAVLAAFSRLKRRPDVVLFDGQGRAHPRGMGLAAHMGLWLDLPTVGCAKSRLVGEAEEPGADPGEHARLRFKGRVIGAVLRTRSGVKPVYVSAGHKINLADSIRLVLKCCAGYRLPEPTRLAHALVNRVRCECGATA